MNCNLVIKNDNQLSFKNLDKYNSIKQHLTFYHLREKGEMGVEGQETYNFFENDFYLDFLEESIKKVIKDCKYLIDTYKLTGINKNNFERELGTKGSGDGKYQVTKKKLIQLGKIYQKLMAQSKGLETATIKVKSLPIVKTKSTVLTKNSKSRSLPSSTILRAGGKNKKTRKFKNLPRVKSMKKINKNTNLNYTL